MTSISKEHVAIHEAGHAVVAVVRGAPLKETRITQDEAGRIGGDCTSLHRTGRGVPVEDLVQQIAGLFAGTVAERIAGYAESVEYSAKPIWAEIQRDTASATTWGHDLEQALAIANDSLPTEAIPLILTAGWMMAEDFLRTNWRTVEAVTAAMLQSESHSLTGDDVRAVAASCGLNVPLNRELERRAATVPAGGR